MSAYSNSQRTSTGNMLTQNQNGKCKYSYFCSGRFQSYVKCQDLDMFLMSSWGSLLLTHLTFLLQLEKQFEYFN